MTQEAKSGKAWTAKFKKSAEGKKLLSDLFTVYGKYKYIEIIGWNGEIRHFKVSVRRIVTQGIKAQDLLANKYGKEISKKQFQTKA